LKELLRHNRDEVLARIHAAAEAGGRDPSEVRLVAVTKSVASDVALALAGLGQLDLAENRAPVFEEKVAAFRAAGVEVRWHFIGHIQRNKARRVARLADVIHSVDSLALLETLDRVCAEEGLRREIYLQVKVADESAKGGLAPDEVAAAAARAAASASLTLRGLMAMAPLEPSGDRQAAAAEAFAALRTLSLDLPHELFGGPPAQLSMGMSGDYEIAVREGAHLVRVGTALFRGLRAGEPAP